MTLPAGAATNVSSPAFGTSVGGMNASAQRLGARGDAPRVMHRERALRPVRPDAADVTAALECDQQAVKLGTHELGSQVLGEVEGSARRRRSGGKRPGRPH